MFFFQKLGNRAYVYDIHPPGATGKLALAMHTSAKLAVTVIEEEQGKSHY